METQIVTGVTGVADPNSVNMTIPEDSMGPTQKQGEKILGKFNSAEELAKAYEELEKKLGSAGKTTEEDENTVDEDDENDEPTQGEVEEILAVAGLEYDTLAKEYADNGTLTEESYEALKKAGIPKKLVDSYIAGQEALVQKQQEFAEATVKELKEIAGGDEGYTAVVKWASTSLSEEEISAFNMAIGSGNKALASMAIRGLVESYNREYGSTPKLLGGGNPGLAEEGFNDVDEMVKAMSDPRYKTDAHYRKNVEAKVARSGLMRGRRR